MKLGMSAESPDRTEKRRSLVRYWLWSRIERNKWTQKNISVWLFLHPAPTWRPRQDRGTITSPRTVEKRNQDTKLRGIHRSPPIGAIPPETFAAQVGHTLCVRQGMLPQDISVGKVCIFMCLATSSTILILSVFSLYVMMYRNNNPAQNLRRETEQADKTAQEPLCLRQQF